jgi:hypothetical protein
MTNDRAFSEPLGQALSWLEPLHHLIPNPVVIHVEVSSGLLIVALIALWIWRRPWQRPKKTK